MMHVVIPVYNQLAYTQSILADLFDQTVVSDIVIVDNGSTDGTAEYLGSEELRVRLREWSGTLTVLPNGSNEGVARAWNRATEHICKQVNIPIILYVNNDVVLPPWTLEEIQAAFDQDATCAAVSPVFTRLELPLGFPDAAETARTLRNQKYRATSLAGFCFALHMDRIGPVMPGGPFAAETGYLFEEFSKAWYEDTDLWRRMNVAGLKMYQLPGVLIHHFESKTLHALPPDELQHEIKQARDAYVRKWETNDGLRH